jgi:hypothetical protein
MRSAWTGENPNNSSKDLSATILFAEILQVCYTIVVTDEIDQRYRHLFSTLTQGRSQSPASLNIVALYTTAWQTTGKIDSSRRSADLPSLSDETHIKNEDIEFSRLAGISRSILVTGPSWPRYNLFE